MNVFNYSEFWNVIISFKIIKYSDNNYYSKRKNILKSKFFIDIVICKKKSPSFIDIK